MNRGKIQFESIASFIHGQYGPFRVSLTQETRLFEDLRIDGDDATELLATYSQTFQVDMSKFKLHLYVGDEGIDLLGAIHSFFTLKKLNLTKPLTLGMLEEAAKLGYWPEKWGEE